MLRARIALAVIATGACATRTIDTVSISGGSDEQQRALARAVNEADRIWRSPTFWDHVSAHTWIPGPGAFPVRGNDVRTALESVRPGAQDYRLVWFFGKRIYTLVRSNGNAETVVHGPISILRRRVPADTLVGTVAHETCHVVPGDDKSPRYWDRGYTALELPWLVSNGVGDLALCFVSSGGDAERVEACFAQTLNGGPACRTYRQCCDGGDTVPAHIRAARLMAPQCASRCEEIRARCEWAGIAS